MSISVFCQKMQAVFIRPELEKVYDSLQADFRTFSNMLMDWALLPYTEDYEEDGKTRFRIHHSEDVLVKLRVTIPKKFLDDVLYVGRQVATGSQSDVSSFYGLFNINYTPRGVAKFTERVEKNFIQVRDSSDGDFAKLIQEYDFPTLSPNREIACFISSLGGVINITKIRNRLQNGETIRSVWDQVSYRFAKAFGPAVARLRDGLGIKVTYPYHMKYCRMLAEMVRCQVSSFCEILANHLTDTAEIEKNLASKMKAAGDIFSAIRELSERTVPVYLRTMQLLVGKRKPLISEDGVVDKSRLDKANPSVRLLCEEVEAMGITALLGANRQRCFDSVVSLKLQRQLDRRRTYPRRPSQKNDYAVPFGIINYMGFRFTQRIGLNVDFLDLPEMAVCTIPFKRSHYFFNLKIYESRHEGSRVGYQLTFCHATKRRGKIKEPVTIGREITGLVKEIKLQRRKGKFYIAIPFTVEQDDTNSRFASYFITAEPDKKKLKLLPDSFRAMGVDLNLCDPVVVAVAEVQKGDESGDIRAIDYGSACVIGEPEILCHDTALSSASITITRQCWQIIEAIRAYKVTLRDKTKVLEEDTLKFLQSLVSPSPSVRSMIQTRIANLGKRLHKIQGEMNSTGHRNISEGLRLLEAKDAYGAMISSYERIHLKPGEQLLKKKKFDERRANFRLNIARKVASAIAKYAVAHNINVVFLENLKFRFDRDNNTNSLSRLFAAGMLVKTIENALRKVGIGCAPVDQAGTSKTDPLTGMVGFRSKEDKKKLHVWRNGKVVWIDSDKAASLNILIRGLGHSVVPYKFWVGDFDKNDKNDIGKRRSRFFRTMFGTTKPKFFITEEDEAIVTCKKKVCGGTQITSGYLYFTCGQLKTESQYRAVEAFLESSVRDLWALKKEVPQINVTSIRGKCGNFRLPEVLD